MVSALSAQIQVGPEFGLTHTTMGMTINDIKYNNSYVVGAKVGVAFDIPVDGLFYLQPSLSFGFLHGGKASYKNYYREGSGVPVEISDERTYQLYSVQLPVLFTMKTDFTYSPNNFTFGVGPYFNLNYGGYYSRTYYTSLNGLNRYVYDDRAMKIGEESVAADIRPFEIGCMAAVGYEMGMGLNFKLYYSMGFNDMGPTGGMVNNRFKSWGGGLNISYYINRPDRY